MMSNVLVARAVVLVAVTLVGAVCTSNAKAVRPAEAQSHYSTSLAIDNAAAPSPRTSVNLAYYPPDHEVVLFAGDTPYKPRPPYEHGLGDTWVFNAHGWRLLHPKTSPPPREGGLLVYDPKTRLLMLFGGYSALWQPTTVLSDTWAWNGTDWRRLHPAMVPTWMPGASIAFDLTTDYVTELAPRPGYPGSFAPIATFNGDQSPVGRWLWTGQTWLYRSERPAPPMISATFVDDPLSGEMLFFGATPFDSSCPKGPPCAPPDPTGTLESQTWLWNGRAFTRQTPAHAPNWESLVVSDSRIRRTVAIEPSGDLWVWSGSTWTRVKSPKGRKGCGAAVYDPALGDVVVFGTTTSTGSPTNQTWLWNGSRWTVAP